MDITERKVYVASSWRNPIQVAVVHALRATGMSVYDFKQPEGPGSDGFHWTDISLSDPCSPREYLNKIHDPIAEHGFKRDMDALLWANTCVLVLPCGRSAHLELGWSVGRKETFVLMDDPFTPDLMYKMVDHIVPSLFDLLGLMGVKD